MSNQLITDVTKVSTSKGWTIVAILPNKQGDLFIINQTHKEYAVHRVIQGGSVYFESGSYCDSLDEALDVLSKRSGVVL